MKNYITRLCLLALVLGFMVETADAQQRKPSRPKSKEQRLLKKHQ